MQTTVSAAGARQGETVAWLQQASRRRLLLKNAPPGAFALMEAQALKAIGYRGIVTTRGSVATNAVRFHEACYRGVLRQRLAELKNGGIHDFDLMVTSTGHVPVHDPVNRMPFSGLRSRRSQSSRSSTPMRHIAGPLPSARYRNFSTSFGLGSQGHGSSKLEGSSLRIIPLRKASRNRMSAAFSVLVRLESAV